ncbi:MAG: hypothetical protein Q7U47_03660 [Paludibacter sp.]|nr:hypothetical protein [Paludibacter sp.]
MKTKLFFLIVIILSMLSVTNVNAATYTGTQSTVISYTTNYTNNMSEIWNITSSDLTKPITIYYNIGTESSYDFLTINEVDNNGVYTSQLLRISGTQSGFISTNTPNGRVQVVFTSDGSICYANNNSLYWGINVTFSTNNNYFVNNNLQTNGNAYIAGNLGVGTTSPLSKLDVIGEIRSSLNNGVSNLRMIGGSYAAMLRNDGTDTHFLLTNSNNANGGWNSLRPWHVNNSTGNISFADGKVQIAHSTGEVSFPIEKRIGAYLSDNFVYKTKPMGNYSIGWFTDNEASGTGPALWMSGYNGVKLFTQSTPRLTVLGNGKIGIGTTLPDELLTVNGIIHAKEVKVDLTGPLADFVFDPAYNLMPLTEVEQFVKTNRHLPMIPSATEVQTNGLNLGEMQNKLLQKIEELTLYVIEQQKRIEQLEKNQR